MMSFLILFGLVACVFFFLSAITFFGDDISSWYGRTQTTRKLAREKEEKRARELASMREQGVDILAEHHSDLRAKMQEARYNVINDWEVRFAAMTGEHPQILAPDTPVKALGTGQTGMILDVNLQRVLDRRPEQHMLESEPHSSQKIRPYDIKKQYGTVDQSTYRALCTGVEQGSVSKDQFERITGERYR